MSMSVLPNLNATAGVVLNSISSLDVINRWPIAATAFVTCVAAYLIQIVFKSDGWAGIPMVGTEYGGPANRRKMFVNGEAKNLYLEGYRKFKERAFQITTANKLPNIVVAPKFMNELRKLPDDVLSFNKAAEESMHAKYTGLNTNIELLPHTIKTALTPALVRLNPVVADEVADALRTELPQSCSWTEVKIMEKIMRVVAIASGRVFVGPELCRNEEYLNASINYTVEVLEAVRAVSEIVPWLRLFLANRTPEVKKVRRCIKEADKFLRPVVTARREAAKNPDYQKPDDLLEWIMDAQSKFGNKDDKELARIQLSTSFAAIHTTTITATNALYTLAAMPELVTIFREEVNLALAESNGVFTSGAMQNMKKLDSFLKETMRYYALESTSFQRKVLKTFTLSNGQVIPAGAIIELPAIGISNDEEFFPNYDNFDPLRFFKSRQEKIKQEKGIKQAETVANAQFVSVGPSSLTFGYGRHACPGRFFAVNEIKMIMATLLTNYDMKNIGTERYANLEFGEMAHPDPERKVLLRRIQEE